MEQASSILDRMNNILVAGIQKRNISVSDHSFSLIVNNLGGVPPVEMTFLAGKALDKFDLLGINVTHISIGPLMTSLDMNGFSLSLLARPNGEQNYLLGSTGAPSWLELQPVIQDDFLIPLDMPEEKVFDGEKISQGLKESI